jgi:diacylglycerol kinase (ATP)
MNQPRPAVNTRRGLKRLLAATGFSLTGIRTAWQSEEAFRQEAVLALLLLPTAWWLGTTAVERLMLAGSVLLVLIVELLNTAVEYTVDRIGTDHHELSGRAKDIGSAAVLLSLLLWALTWGTIAWTRFFGAAGAL